MDGSIDIFADNTLADKDSVLVVVSIPWHEANENISSESKLTMVCAWTVGKD